MKIIGLYRSYKIFWIRNQTNLLLILGIISILAWVYLGVTREVEMRKQAKAPTVLSVNDKVMLSVKKDSIKLTILKQNEDSVLIKVKQDTLR